MIAKNNKNGLFKKLLYIGLVIIIIMLLVEMYNTSRMGQEILLTGQDGFEEKVQEGEISDVFASGGIVRVRKKDSTIKVEEFPNASDFYLTYSYNQLETIDNIIRGYNNNVSDVKKINYKAQVQGESFMSQVLPYISILLIVFMGYMLFKAIGSGNKGAMSFGKSRAQVGEDIKVRFSDIAGAVEEKEELMEVVEFLKNPKKFTDVGARIPKGVLLVGPPGTGKTLLAKAVAGESNVPFFSISGSDFVEMFVGVGAARVRDLFENAKKNMPCIVFIDEIDAVGRKRGAGLGGGNDEREQTLNQLLVAMDGFQPNDGIIVLAATNRSDVLDPALTRPGRFDRQVYINVPDVKGREGIIKIHARNKPIDESVNYKTLARITSGFTGADLENMLNEAAILTARDNRILITMNDLQEGIKKVIMGPQKKSSIMTQRDKEITAYHEAGHAIIGKTLEHCDEVHEVSIIPRGNAGGYTMSRPSNDDKYVTYDKLMDLIAMSMGGRIAEEIKFDSITTGASSDIKSATSIASDMVKNYGMSKKLGFVSLGSSNEVFIGRDYQTQNLYSEKIAGEIDSEIHDILNINYKKAKEILTKNLKVLDEMSKLLLEKETIYQEEVDMLMSGKSAEDVSKFMDKNEEEAKKKQVEAKEKQAKNIEDKELDMKIKTAEVLVKAGVITDKEFQEIKKKKEEIEQSEIKEQEPKEEIKIEKKVVSPTKNKPQKKEDKSDKTDKSDK